MCTQSELKQILNKVTAIYREMYQDNLCGVFLYGSYARGDYDEESDIDIAAVVRGRREILQLYLKKIWEATSDMEIDYGVMISPTVIPYDEFENYKMILPYYRNIAEEGVRLDA